MEWIRRETIGHGSFSTVSLATTSGSSTTFPPLIAVKSSGVVSSAALMNERDVLDDLGDCSEIVRCFGEGRTVENGEEIYNLFLEYASGGTLADRIKNSGEALPEFEVRRFTRSIVKGLCHIHKNGISHCDLKLENVLVFGDGDVKISDFGLAKRTSDEIGVEIRGTPLYMAPECLNHGEFESPADIWALGCSVVEMSSGKTAWCLDEEGVMSNVMSLMVRIGSGDEVPRIPVELSEEGKDFVSKCFVKNAAERWTAQMLLDHPFLAVDDDDDESGSLRCGEEDEASVSPRNPFDFPGWNSVQSPVNDSVSFSSLVSSPVLSPTPEERISGLVSEMVPDWSVSCDWVNVR